MPGTQILLASTVRRVGGIIAGIRNNYGISANPVLTGDTVMINSRKW